MVSDAVTIAAITTIGGIVGGYMKIQGDRREKSLRSEIERRSEVHEEANRQRKVQSAFNEAAAETMIRVEQKMDALNEMHNRPDTVFATSHIDDKVGALHAKVDELDKKANITVTNTEVIKSKCTGQ